MDNEKIIEQIVSGLKYYLEILAIPDHMKKHSDQMCSWIKPKAGIEHGPQGVYDIDFGNKTDDEVREIIKMHHDKGAPHCWFVSPLTKPDNLRAILTNMDEYVIEDYGMAIPPENVEYTRSLLKNENTVIQIRKVNNKEDFKIWASIINTSIFDSPLLDSDFYYPLCENGKIVCFLGYCGETPVSTSCVFINGNGIGRLEFIATLPDYRNKGMGKAVCCAGIEQLLNDGACIITLTAREMGVSLYKSLGFKIYY